MPTPFTPDQMDRYARHLVLGGIGGSGQRRLWDAKVLVIGAGGLGSPAIFYLAAAGVGTIGVADDDTVDVGNLQRQILHSTLTVNMAKTESASEAVARLNPDVTVIQYFERLTPARMPDLLAAYDVVLDCTDNFASRFLINDACVLAQKPLVAGAALRFDGQVAVYKPHAGAYPCYRCFVPALPDDPAAQADCATAGVLGAVCGVIGSLQAAEAIKEILGLGETLAGRLVLYDGLAARTRVIALPRDPACPACGEGAVYADLSHHPAA